MGRGIQALFTPQPTSKTQTYTISIENTRFQLDHHDGPTDQRTDGRTDKASYRVACPQLKRNQQNKDDEVEDEDEQKRGFDDYERRLDMPTVAHDEKQQCMRDPRALSGDKARLVNCCTG